MGSLSDQSDLVYGIGEVWLADHLSSNPHILSLQECERYANSVILRHGGRPVLVDDGMLTPQISSEMLSGARNRVPAQADGLQMWLPTWARNQVVILHEVGHVLCHQQDIDQLEHSGHGPLFVRLFIDLLACHLGLGLASLLAQARAKGIQVATHPVLLGIPMANPRQATFTGV